MTTKVVPSPKNEERNVAKEALNYLIEGKRHLVVQDYPSAVSSFQESCKLYTEKYGEMANECGEVYFFYGKALLELARLEIGVLGNALEGVPSEDDDAESEDDQVENPENVTGEEREMIIHEVDAAIDENSRDLDDKLECCREVVQSSNSKQTDSLGDFNKAGKRTESVIKKTWEDSCSEKLQFGDNVALSATLTPEVQGQSEKNVTVVHKPVNVEVGRNKKKEQNLFVNLEIPKGNIKQKDELLTTKTSEKIEDENEASHTKDKVVVATKKEQKKTKGQDASIEEHEHMETDEEVKVQEKEGENPEDEEDEDLDEEQNKETEEVVKNNVKERGLSELQPSTSSGEKSTKDDEEDEISNLQLAWEVLELAKVICKRQADGGDYLMRLKTSEVLLKLGEVSIESENYSQAVNDLNECLQMRKELLQPDDRNLADAFFQLGLAYSLDNQFDNAIEHYEKAIQVIEDRIVNLQKSLKDKLQDSQDDSVNIIKEIDELKEIIPDIKSKIEDTADIKRNFEETMREAAAKRLHTSEENNLSNTDDDSTSQNVSPTKAATSIAHLVKRKAKKPRPDEDNTSLTSDKTEANGKIQTSVDVGEKLEAQAKKRTDIQTT
ncbi:protein HGV2-like isoform X2 [Tachypleus tridentatus]|uniref:protein HGV2-like isoform X2 n=1 Tax=Tachypleus tridentatus TaxID=6853 RepID=UPI003FD37B0F